MAVHLAGNWAADAHLREALQRSLFVAISAAHMEVDLVVRSGWQKPHLVKNATVHLQLSY